MMPTIAPKNESITAAAASGDGQPLERSHVAGGPRIVVTISAMAIGNMTTQVWPMIQPRTNGFGYDPIFRPAADHGGRTLAEFTDAQKNAISHRGNAFRAMADLLRTHSAELGPYATLA